MLIMALIILISSEIFGLIHSSEDFALQYIPPNTEVEELNICAVATENMLAKFGPSQHNNEYIDDERALFDEHIPVLHFA